MSATFGQPPFQEFAGFLVIESFVFTKNVLSWQTELSSLESQIREAAKRYVTARAAREAKAITDIFV